MRVTTWAEYGLIVSLHLAKQGNNGPTPARDMAKREGLPADYVEPATEWLVRNLAAR